MTTSKQISATAYSIDQPCKWCGDQTHHFSSAVSNHCLWCGTTKAHTWDECGARLLSAGK